MTILTRQERERLVLDLYYNQAKTYREISKAARISPRDIGVILNKAIEEKTKGEEGIKQQGNNGAEKNQNQEQQQQQSSLSAQAYKLFSNRKTPLEVAIELNLRESEATKFYKEYWKLNQQHNLNMVYEETKGDIEPFLRLFRLSKAKGMGPKQVVNLLAMANEDLPAIEKRIKRLRNEISALQFQKRIDERNLYRLNNQIATTSKLLNSICMSCRRERGEIENLYDEKTRLEAIVTGFKNNNEEYLTKIKQAAEEKIKDVLTNGKFLLQFAVASVIESLRSNPELCNFMMYYNSNNTATISYGSNYPSFMSGGQQQHQQQSFNYSYTALILEEAEKLYNKLITEFTNRSMAAAASIRGPSLPVPGNNNKQKSHKIYNTYQTEESRYNNQNRNL
jgi:hypothetical protein